MRTKQYLFLIFFITGILLICNNIWGLFVSLRNPDIYIETNTDFENDITLTENELYEVINSANSNPKEYVTRINETIFKSISDYWEVEGADKYNLRVPFHENFLLFF